MVDEKQLEKRDYSKYLIKVSGRDYYTVAGRLVQFRDERPTWSIETAPLELNHEKGFAVFRAEIKDETGRVLATGTKHENRHGFADFLEKAETGSVGRALLMLGYGTANALEELDEGARLADAPFPNGAQAAQNGAAARPAHGTAPQPVKPKLDPFAIREEYCELAKQAGFKGKPELDQYLRQKGIDKLDRVETMARACDLLKVYITKLKAGEGDADDVWAEEYEAEDAREPVKVV